MDDKIKPIVVLSIGLILLVLGGILAFYTYETDKEVKCFDRLHNEIQGVECKDELYIPSVPMAFMFAGGIITFFGMLALILDTIFN